MFRRPLLAVAVLASFTLAPGPAHAGKFARRYPEMAVRRDSLGPITLLVESAVVVDVDGDVKRVELETSRKLAELAGGMFRDSLVAHGFTVREAATASLGTLYDPARTFHPATASGQSDTSRVLRAPFFEDSTLAGRPQVAAAWSTLCRRVLGYERKNKAAPDSAAEAVMLGDSLGSPVIGVVVLNGWNVPTGKQIRQALLTGLLSAGMVTAHKVPVSRFQFALVDARSGEILWSDFGYWQVVANEKLVHNFVAASIKELP